MRARFDAFETHRDLSKLMHDAVTGESIHIFDAGRWRWQKSPALEGSLYVSAVITAVLVLNLRI